MPEKKLFEKSIRLNHVGNIDTYPDDITQVFSWMQHLKFPKNAKILDVGANIGMYSLAYASMFEGAEIHSFEPVPFIFDYLN